MSAEDVFSAIADKSVEQSTANDGGVTGDISKSVDASGGVQPQAGGSGKTVLKPSSAQAFAKLNNLTTEGFKEVKDTIKEGFETMRESFFRIWQQVCSCHW